MNLAKYLWSMHQYLVSKRIRFYSRSPRFLLITHNNKILQSQVYPFFHYRKEIFNRFGLHVDELDLEHFKDMPASKIPVAEVVVLQTWFNVTNDELEILFGKIREYCRPQKLVFMDGFAPTDLRLASATNDHVDVYIKKHVLSDRSLYGKSTQGDTNLTDFYSRKYGLHLPDTTFPIPDGFLEKLIVGPTFFTSVDLTTRFKGQLPDLSNRPFDLHARFATKGSDWYSSMRLEAESAVSKLQDIAVVTGFGIDYKAYMQELLSTKMCLSPFGYGEICWRDYEAIASGCLLIKPDVSHIQTEPSIFVPNETYVPVDWDFGNLEEVVTYYRENEPARNKIVMNGFNALKAYLNSNAFIDQMEDVLHTKSTNRG